MLADLVRTDRHQHRPIAGDTELAEAIKVLARAHQSMGWMRGQPQVNQLRSSTLREFYPAALAAFGGADPPRRARGVGDRTDPWTRAGALTRSRIEAALLPLADRQCNLSKRAEEIRAALRHRAADQSPRLVAACVGEPSQRWWRC